METITIKDQKVNLVEGTFTPSEACDVVTALIQEKINFHKLQRLSWCEGNQNANTAFPDGRISELEQELANARAFIDQYREQGVRLKLDGQLILSVDK